MSVDPRAPALFDLTGKVAIVTGGNGGIGLGMAKGLADAGAAVIIAARDAAKGEAAVRELSVSGAKSAFVAVDVTGAFLRAQAAYSVLCEAGGGKIVNIGSMMSVFGAAFAVPYAASKGGLLQLTKALATAWAKHNIQVNAVLPGWIDTDLTRKTRREIEGFHERIESRTPARRWGAPRDLAGIAVFLSAPASDFITGAAIPVDGGYAAQG